MVLEQCLSLTGVSSDFWSGLLQGRWRMADWTTDVSNDPETDFGLVIELIEGGEYRARVVRDQSGHLVLQVYSGPALKIPAEWLMSVLRRAEEDLR